MPTVIRLVLSVFVVLYRLAAAAFKRDRNTNEMTWALGLAILMAIFATA